MRRRQLLHTAGAAALALGAGPAAGAAERAPGHDWLPRWRGFNLVEKVTLAGNAPFLEWDFDFLARWGFDFVRLPLDYRIWTPTPGRVVEAPLREIDQAIGWARARRIHVCLCLHRAPGYCVNPPAEPLDLWRAGPGGDEVRRQFAAQWRMFAERYRGIPSSALSFNLVNEPPAITAAQYLAAAALAVAVIRAADPARLVIADGVPAADSGRRPVPELAGLQVAQSTRGYSPSLVSHYRASWVAGSDAWPTPTWPVRGRLGGFLYGDRKPDLQGPLTLELDQAQPTELVIRVDRVSAEARLRVEADGADVFDHLFRPGPGAGEWADSQYMPQWHVYQARYDRDYAVRLPAGARRLTLALGAGDWLSLGALTLAPWPGVPGDRLTLRPVGRWGVRPGRFRLTGAGELIGLDHAESLDKAWLWHEQIEPWLAVQARGVGVHVGEWGAYRFTPHAVVLAWMADCLAAWQAAGWGWALWNLRGGFGPLDSGRIDVRYEAYDGHKLDRAMLALLAGDGAR